MTWKESVIAYASEMLSSSISTVNYEAANYPNHEAFTNTNQSLQKAAQSLVLSIKQEREAESAFFAGQRCAANKGLIDGLRADIKPKGEADLYHDYERPKAAILEGIEAAKTLNFQIK